jgi:hypothetical protein
MRNGTEKTAVAGFLLNYGTQVAASLVGERSHRTSRPEGGGERREKPPSQRPEPRASNGHEPTRPPRRRRERHGAQRRATEQEGARGEEERQDATVARRGPVQRSSRGARGTEHAPVSQPVPMVARAAAAAPPP